MQDAENADQYGFVIQSLVGLLVDRKLLDHAITAANTLSFGDARYQAYALILKRANDMGMVRKAVDSCGLSDGNGRDAMLYDAVIAMVEHGANMSGITSIWTSQITNPAIREALVSRLFRLFAEKADLLGFLQVAKLAPGTHIFEGLEQSPAGLLIAALVKQESPEEPGK